MNLKRRCKREEDEEEEQKRKDSREAFSQGDTEVSECAQPYKATELKERTLGTVRDACREILLLLGTRGRSGLTRFSETRGSRVQRVQVIEMRE